MADSATPVTAAGARRGDIQGLRALAVVAVVAYHAGSGFSGGYVGVDVFFVISGYVITRMMLSELRGTGRLDLRRFYLRRVRRLLPALSLVLAVVMVLGVAFTALGAQAVTARTGAAAALVNANHYLALFGLDAGYFAIGSKANPLLHTWSLSVEEQFYLGFPLLILGAWRLGVRFGRASATALLLMAIVAVSFPLSIALRHGLLLGDSSADFAFYGAPPRAWEFAVGALLAWFAPRIRTLPPQLARASSLVGLVLVGIAIFAYDDGTLFPDFAVVMPVVGTALLIAAGEAAPRSWVARTLSVRPVQRIGDVSYGWYLWHWPCIVFAVAIWPGSGLVAPVAAAVSYGMAEMSYRWWEQPIRQRPTVTGRSTVRLAGACVLVPLLAAAVLSEGRDRLLDTSLASDFALHLDVRAGCDSSLPLGGRPTSTCHWGGTSQAEAVLIGDSNAGQFTEGLMDATRRQGVGLRVVTYSGCPFASLAVWQHGVALDDCQRFVRGSLAALQELRPSVVYIASSSDIYINDPAFAFGVDEVAAPVSDPVAKAQLWGAAQGQVVTQLTSVGIEVIIIHAVPKFPLEWRPSTMAPLRLLMTPDSLSIEMSRPGALARRQLSVNAEVAAALLGGGSTIDPFDELCPLDPCSTRLGSTWQYRDHGHISVRASESLGEWFVVSLSIFVD